MNIWFFILPFAGALVGWLLNYLLSSYLFYPIKAITILGQRLQGIIPSSQQRLATKLAEFADQEMMGALQIEEKLKDPSHFEKIRPVVEKHVDEFLRVRLGKEMPMISMFVGDKTIDKMKTVFMKELEDIFPQVIAQLGGNLQQELDIRKIVTSKISSIPPADLITRIRPALSLSLRKLRWAGALTGFIIGVVQLIILWVVR